MSQIPKEDRIRIERLFSFLVWDETFAYVLFGNKPMAVTTQDKTAPKVYLEKFQYTGYELEALWKTWERYAHLLPTKEFVFLIENHEKWFNLNLLNKSNCLKVIENNLTLFQEKTGCSLNAADMFDYIVANAGNDLFKNSLNKSQALYGILLGYGTKNSLGFENYFSMNKNIGALPPKCDEHIDVEDSRVPMIPCFSSFSRAESQKLIDEYTYQREEILKIYSKRNFLKTTINRLTMQK